MYDLFIKSTIIFALLVIAVRLMGKRQLGELQPFEFVITLLIANVASVPIVDSAVPIENGIVPIITLYIGHSVIVWLAFVSIRARSVINGKPMTLINNDGIVWSALKKAHMNVNDLVSALRQQGYFSLDVVAFAVLETNGKVSVLEKPNCQENKAELPYVLIAEGKIMERNVALLKLNKFDVFWLLDKYDVLMQDVLLLTLTESGMVVVQPKQGKCISGKVDLVLNG